MNYLKCDECGHQYDERIPHHEICKGLPNHNIMNAKKLFSQRGIINLATLTQKPRNVRFDEKGQLGIENLKTTIDVLLKVGEGAEQLIKDGPTTSEGVQLGLIILDAAGKIDVYKAALLEFRDLDPTESKEITEHFNFAFDIENNELEAKIEKLINLLPRAYQFIILGVELFFEGREVLGSFKKAA